MLKKVSVCFLVIVLIISLVINFLQYGQIRYLNERQDNIDKELKAQIQALITCLEENNRNKKALEEHMRMVNLTLGFSSYSLSYATNQIVSDTFIKLQNQIYNIENNSADEIRQISSILKEIIKPEKSAIDIGACEKLNNYLEGIKF